MSPRSGFRLWLIVGLFLAALSNEDRPVSAGDNYAFLVAVSDYDVKQLRSLPYTRNDIRDFGNLLVDSGFKPDNVVVMHDDLATLKNRRYFPEAARIRRELQLLLAGVDEGDSVIVAFAGHGVQFEKDDKNYFCPSDADLEQKGTLVSLKEIYDQLEKCQADRKLLLVDACRNDPQSKLSRSRETVKLKSVTRPQVEPVPKGIVALFSCSAGEESFEFPDLQHGIFFHHVLAGWQGAADTGDRELSLDELVAFARKNTQTFTRTKLAAIQTPQLKGDMSGTWVLRDLRRDGKSLRNSLAMDLVLIPAGEFLMGSPDSDGDANDDEKPQQQIRITRPFYLGTTEVTQGQWKAVMGTEPWKAKSYVKEGSQYPATYVSWDDAVEFCRKLSETEGETYRLPTEAEWEFACRAGTTTKYHFGDSDGSLGTHAWFDKNAWDIDEKYSHEVAQKKANPWGLYDMHGNVWEWCSDSYSSSHTNLNRTTSEASSSARVFRGGSWFNNARTCRCAFRNKLDPVSQRRDIGFRIVRLAK
jgi:formylglycine-generating enzyme required for sulfatase activity